MAGQTVVGFRIKIPMTRETTDTQKAIEKQRKTLSDIHKKELPALNKATKDYLANTKRAANDAERAAESLGSTFSKSMERGLSSVNKFTSGLGSLKDKLINIKTIIAASAIGGAGIWAGRTIYQQGKQQLATYGRIKREFGDESQDFFDLGNRVGGRAGIQGDDAAAALIPLGEQLQSIQKGSRFRGMKKALTEDQAEKLRFKNLAFGANVIERIQTLSPDMDSEDIGRAVGDALSGPEGIKSLIGMLHLSKRSKTLSAANERGEAYKSLSPSEQKKLGITKKGEFLEQGDLVTLLLDRSGMTEEAAEGKRKKLGFQLKSIGAMAEDALGDIGASALEKFNGGMSKGATLAERFSDALKSKQGKAALEGAASAAASLAEGIISVAANLPKIGSFLSEHKTLLITMGGALVGLKGMSIAGGWARKLSQKSEDGLAGSIMGKLGGGKYKGATPVYVVNGDSDFSGLAGAAGKAGKLGKLAKFAGGASSVLAAGMAGYALGTAIDETFGISDKIGGWANKDNAKDAAAKNEISVARVIMARVKAGKETGAQAAAELERFAQSAEGKKRGEALSPEVMAIINAFKNLPPPVIQMDGQTVATVVSRHQEKAIDTASAHGAAPVHRE